MQFSGQQLGTILQQQGAEVAVYDAHGSFRGNVSPHAAVRIIAEREYVGIGNKRRIRYIRPLWGTMSPEALRNGSRTTRRIRNDHGVIIAPRLHVEHKPTNHHSLTE